MKTRLFFRLFAALSIATAAFGQPASAEDSTFSLSSELAHSSGKFQTGPWAFKVTVPTAMVSGASVPVSTAGRFIPGDTQTTLGDTEAAATYRIYSGNASSFGIDLTGKVKLNLADKYFGLTSFQNDYAAQADAYQSFDRFKALGSLGYKLQTDPAGINMNRVLYGSVGGAYQLNDQISGGVDFRLAQSPTPLDQGIRQLGAYVSHSINKSFKAKGYVQKDFSRSNSDRSVGAAVSYGF